MSKIYENQDEHNLKNETEIKSNDNDTGVNKEY